MVSQVASPRREYIQNRLTVSVGDGIGEDSVLQQCLHVPFGCTLCIIISLVLLTKIDIPTYQSSMSRRSNQQPSRRRQAELQ